MRINEILRWNICLLGSVLFSAAPASALRENPESLTARACHAMLEAVIKGPEGAEPCSTKITAREGHYLCDYLVTCYEGTPNYDICRQTQEQFEQYCKDNPLTQNEFKRCVVWYPEAEEVSACCNPQHARDLWEVDDQLEGMCQNKAVVDFTKVSQ